VNHISGTAERICAKFAGKTCLVPRSDEFECQGQMSRSPGTKTCCALPSPPAATEWNAFATNNVRQQQTVPLRRYQGVISARCVRLCLVKTSLALFWCLFLSESNISGTAERICAKFTGKTCLVPRWDEFEFQGQRSRSPKTKNALCTPIIPFCSDGTVRSAT